MANNTQTYNITDVWKASPNIGSTTYINVADGTTRVVPWGVIGWMGELMACGLLGGAGYLIAKYAFKF